MDLTTVVAGYLQHLSDDDLSLLAVAAGLLLGTMQVVAEAADRFGDARRILNLVTDRYLFRFRSRWFPAPRD